VAPARNNPASLADREVVSTRVFAASPGQLYQAFADPAVLARWWGPDGFTNVVQEFDLRPGGKWRLVMRAPSGTEFANESEFVVVEPARRVVYRHLEPVHRFDLAMTFAPEGAGTRLTWRMTFDEAAECGRVREFIAAANEQNFDRLESCLT